MSLHRIAVVAFNQISPFHLGVPCAVFAARHPALADYELQVCSAEGVSLTTSAGFALTVEPGLEILADAATIIIPSWRDASERPPQPLLEALIAAHQRGARIVGLCLGAYVLAEAGLLAGHSATTHWAYAQDFSQRYPAVTVNADVLYVDEGALVTSAGTAAALDCCLHLLRQQVGAEAASAVARRLVVAPHRQGGQAQFIDQPLPATARDSRLAGLVDWVRANLHLDHNLDSLAAKALMSRRTFTRHFRQLTATTVGQWLISERLALAQRLLETTDQPIDRIAALCGFGSVESLRHHFRAAFSRSPQGWRQSFRGD